MTRDIGLVKVGGRLTPESVVAAYRRGLFPWYDEGMPVCWWSPDPRAIIELNSFHVPRRLQRILRQGKFHFTFDRAFAEVIRGCAANRPEGTWITADMMQVYTELHGRGIAHSVETWLGSRLVGGVYGLALGGYFSGESMFHTTANASNAALVALVEHLRRRGYVLFDIQILNDHTARFGGREIPRQEFLRRLEKALELPVTFADGYCSD
ncbi:MAG: leucyl/phenylalanyl-tRNA--protein transferase [Gemmataceae bacterium]